MQPSASSKSIAHELKNQSMIHPVGGLEHFRFPFSWEWNNNPN